MRSRQTQKLIALADKTVLIMPSVAIPVYKPSLRGDEARYVKEAIESSWISSKGKFIEQFEEQFSRFTGVPYVTSVFNGTVALHVALAALGIGPGDKVLVPAFTYVASVNAIRYCGATPVFVDSERDSWQISLHDLRRKMTSRVRAVMAVHLYGQACDMPSLADWCRESNLLLIEDCAEAFGTKIGNRHVGSWGDVGTFSFFGNKTLTTGEGGMVVSGDGKVIDRVRHLKSQGVSPTQEYWHDCVAYNYRMTNVQAAIGLAQIERAAEILERKRRIAHLYFERFAEHGIEVQVEQSGTTHSFWMVSILARDAAHRHSIRRRLRQDGIETRPAFPPVYRFPMYAELVEDGCGDSRFPVASFLGDRGINLPSYPDLSDDEVQFIASKTIHAFNA